MKVKYYILILAVLVGGVLVVARPVLKKAGQNEIAINTVAKKESLDLKSVIGTTTAKNIREVNFEALLEKVTYGETPDFSYCMTGQKPILIDSIKYYDFDNDGKQEAIVRASTCFTGTAGSDIKGVYSLLPAGQVIQLKVNDNGGKYNNIDIYDHSWKDFGYDIKDTRLINIVPIYKDTDANCCHTGGEREIMYEWNGNEFVISKVTIVPFEGN